MHHVINAPELAHLTIDPELLSQIVEEHTLCFEDRFYLKDLDSEEVTAARNLLVNALAKVKSMKKTDLKRMLLEKLHEFNIKIDDKILN